MDLYMGLYVGRGPMGLWVYILWIWSSSPLPSPRHPASVDGGVSPKLTNQQPCHGGCVPLPSPRSRPAPAVEARAAETRGPHARHCRSRAISDAHFPCLAPNSLQTFCSLCLFPPPCRVYTHGMYLLRTPTWQMDLPLLMFAAGRRCGFGARDAQDAREGRAARG